MAGKRKRRKSPLKPFDKFHYYLASVQSPEHDMELVGKTYHELRGRPAKVLREDFCGTFANCCEWVKGDRKRLAYGLDLDREPIDYGLEKYYNKLKPEQQRRVHVSLMNVLSAEAPHADLIIAMNFSFYIFKTRDLLVEYFKNCHRTLSPKGILFTDCFGGQDCLRANEESHGYRSFRYFWHQRSFDPVTHDAKFSIHIQRKGEPKRRHLFRYDWRMWTIPEIRDCMKDAGFVETKVMWEGTTKTGRGNGKYRFREKGDDAHSWVAYVVGLK